MLPTKRFVKGSPTKKKQSVGKGCGKNVERERTLISNDRLITKAQNKEVGRLEKHKKRNLRRKNKKNRINKNRSGTDPISSQQNPAETSEMCSLDKTQITSPANSEHNIEWKEISTAVLGNAGRKGANLLSSPTKTENFLSLKEILMNNLKEKLLSLSNKRRTDTETSQQAGTTLSRFTVPRLDSRVHLNNDNNPSNENKLIGSGKIKSDRQEKFLPICWTERKAIEAPSKFDNSNKNSDFNVSFSNGSSTSTTKQAQTEKKHIRNNLSVSSKSNTLIDPIIKRKIDYKEALVEKHRQRSISLPARISAKTYNKINIQSMIQSAKEEMNANKRKDGKLCKEQRFFCKLAHGGPMGIIKHFETMKELYEEIAKCFKGLSPNDILFCTLNTEEIDMYRLVNHSLCFTDDMLCVHIAGQKKEIQLTKSKSTIGIILTDNGLDKTLIRDIKENSIVSTAIPAIQVGDCVAAINGIDMAGKKHFEVAEFIHQISIGESITLRLIQPIKVGFSSIDSQKRLVIRTELSINRISKAHFNAKEAPAAFSLRVKNILGSYLGFKISNIAKIIWNVGLRAENVHQMILELKKTKVGKYNLSDEVLFDLWGLIADWKSDRLRDQKKNAKN